jgi:hexosaminidase
MKWIGAQVIYFFLFLLISLFFHIDALEPVAIWPKPYQVSVTGSKTSVIINHETFTFNKGNVPPGEAEHLLDGSIQRYRALVFYNSNIAKRSSSPLCQRSDFLCLKGITFSFDANASNTNLDINMDERYGLSVDNNGMVTVQTSSVWGAMRALESFSQLVIIKAQVQDQNNDYYTLNIPTPFAILDRPRFIWRGLMIDTSRHYLSVNKILKLIQAMSYVKFNVLHWHVVDAQSFPLYIPDAPNLIQAAYSPKAIYSLDDVQKIIQVAKSYGIRVVLEFDMPGHAYSWGVGYPEIVAKCPKFEANVNNIPLNPINDRTYEIIEKVIAAVSNVAPEQFMHFGGDELVQSCWKEDQSIVDWMNQRGWTDYNQLFSYFETRLETIYKKYQKKMIAWEELLMDHANLFVPPPDTIIQSWRAKATLAFIVNKGYKALLSAGWYLDKQVPGNHTGGLWADTWRDFYFNDPTAGFTPEQESRVLGGEACMWGEQVDNANIESRIFPRVLGAAERLWSQAKDTQDINEAQARLIFTRCHVLIRRDVKAGPIRPDYCDAVEDQFY